MFALSRHLYEVAKPPTGRPSGKAYHMHDDNSHVSTVLLASASELLDRVGCLAKQRDGTATTAQKINGWGIQADERGHNTGRDEAR